MDEVAATDGEMLFPSRAAARSYLGGVALFWGGSALLVIGLLVTGGRSRPPMWLVLPLAGAVVAGSLLAVRGMATMPRQRAGHGTSLTVSFRTQLDAARPRTLRRVGVEAGFDGTVVAVGLYGLLGIAVVGLLLAPLLR